MTLHTSIQCPAGSGGESDERLFDSYTSCSGCLGDFQDRLVKESKTVGGHYCKKCWDIEEQLHKASPDYDGTDFN